MNKKQNIIFLDFDGVLVTFRSNVGIPSYTKTKLCTKFDESAVRMVQDICDKFDCKIVLSTTWRNQFDTYGDADMFLIQIGFRSDILVKSDDNFNFKTSYVLNGGREDEILKWLGEEGFDKFNWIVIDDDCIFHNKEYQERLFITTMEDGLTYLDYSNICNFFSKKENN